MSIEPSIGFTNEFAIESLLAAAGFITRHEENCPTFRVKSKSHTPNAVGSVKSQLLHVRVPGMFERIDTRTSKIWAKLLEYSRQRKNLVLNIPFQGGKLRLEFVCKKHYPRLHVYLAPYILSTVYPVRISGTGFRPFRRQRLHADFADTAAVHLDYGEATLLELD